MALSYTCRVIVGEVVRVEVVIMSTHSAPYNQLISFDRAFLVKMDEILAALSSDKEQNSHWTIGMTSRVLQIMR